MDIGVAILVKPKYAGSSASLRVAEDPVAKFSEWWRTLKAHIWFLLQTQNLSCLATWGQDSWLQQDVRRCTEGCQGWSCFVVHNSAECSAETRENLGPLRMLNHRSQGDAWRIRTSLLTTMHFLRHSENGAEMCPNKLQNVRSSYWAVADWPCIQYLVMCEMLSLSPSQIFQKLVQPRPINYTLFWSLLMEAWVDFSCLPQK